MLTEGTVPAAAQDGLGTETGAELGGGVVSCSALPCVGFTGHLDTLQELGPVLPSSLSSRVFGTFRVFQFSLVVLMATFKFICRESSHFLC